MCICIFLERFEFLNEGTKSNHILCYSRDVFDNRLAWSTMEQSYKVQTINSIFFKAATNIGILYKAYNLRQIRLGARTMWTNSALGINTKCKKICISQYDFSPSYSLNFSFYVNLVCWNKIIFSLIGTLIDVSTHI